MKNLFFLLIIVFVSCKNKAVTNSDGTQDDSTIQVTRANSSDPNTDIDGDGYYDLSDNCKYVSNPDQKDTNHNGIGDACETVPDFDTDQDGIKDSQDNCPSIKNPDQKDIDGDGIGDSCDEDSSTSTDTPPQTNCLAYGVSTIKGSTNVQLAAWLNRQDLDDKRFITAFGGRIQSNSFKRITIIGTRLLSSGELDYKDSDIISYFTDSSGDNLGEAFVELPPGFVATGVGAATDSYDLILAKLYGSKYDLDGKFVESVECVGEFHQGFRLKSVCKKSYPIYMSSYKEIKVDSGNVLTGIGFTASRGKISGVWAKSTEIINNCK